MVQSGPMKVGRNILAQIENPFCVFLQMVILDLFYDLLNLDAPTVCDSYEAALQSTSIDSISRNH